MYMAKVFFNLTYNKNKLFQRYPMHWGITENMRFLPFKYIGLPLLNPNKILERCMAGPLPFLMRIGIVSEYAVQLHFQ